MKQLLILSLLILGSCRPSVTVYPEPVYNTYVFTPHDFSPLIGSLREDVERSASVIDCSNLEHVAEFDRQMNESGKFIGYEAGYGNSVIRVPKDKQMEATLKRYNFAITSELQTQIAQATFLSIACMEGDDTQILFFDERGVFLGAYH